MEARVRLTADAVWAVLLVLLWSLTAFFAFGIRPEVRRARRQVEQLREMVARDRARLDKLIRVTRAVVAEEIPELQDHLDDIGEQLAETRTDLASVQGAGPLAVATDRWVPGDQAFTAFVSNRGEFADRLLDLSPDPALALGEVYILWAASLQDATVRFHSRFPAFRGWAVSAIQPADLANRR